MLTWAPFPHKDTFAFDAAGVKKHWARLHAGDREPVPRDANVLAAWALFHNGKFQKAFDAGMKAGVAGHTVANKAQCIYATYLEPKERERRDHYLQAAERAAALAKAQPELVNAHFWHAYALGRYSQGISVMKALTQGLGGKIKVALETAIKLDPKHADAHSALGAYHAEVVDKVGSMVGKLTYGASKDVAVKHFETALKLAPDSAIACIEYANALVMLFGDKKMDEAVKLYEKAAASTPVDAMERLDVELAKSELEDE